MSWRDIPLPRVDYDLVRLEGGLDLVTPPLSLKPGVLRESNNFEVSVNGGYTRIPGYERFDGRPAPSAATYSAVMLSAVAGLAVGDAVNGQTSGATAVVAALVGTTVILTKVVGVFQLAENFREGVTVIGTITSLTAGTTDAKTAAQWSVLAADQYRNDIQVVPGAGPVRGVAYFKGSVYAWRNNVGNTALAMWKSSAGGWTAVNLGYELGFSGGLPAGIAVGNTVTGATSGATAVVARVAVQSGTFGASTAAGRLIFTAAPVGVFQNGENLQVAGTTRAVAVGTAAAITLLPDGRVETDIGNIGGLGLSGTKLYGVDGINRGFEFDGTVYVPIVTGMSPDQPTKVCVHKSHLFFAFGASLQFSGIAAPYAWQVILGAGELSLDDVCTNLQVLPGDQTTGAMAVYTRSTTYVLYGTSSANFQLSSYNSGTGALAFSAQTLSSAYVLDDRGVIELKTSLAYGNFADATLTANIRTFIQARRNRTTASGINREKSQYRLFFNDGYGLYLTIVNGKFKGAMPVLFPNAVTCMCSGETPDGDETSFFGSSNGYVYRLDVGPNFDGQAINSSFFSIYNAKGNSRFIKQYRRGSLEITGQSYAEFNVGYDLAYSDATRVDQGLASQYSNNFSAPNWDAFTWDAFVWDGLSLAPSELSINGSAENIAMRVICDGNYIESFTLNSLILHYTNRRGLR